VLTHKLVPLLSKIRTKEPAVMVSRDLVITGFLRLNFMLLDGNIERSRGDGGKGRTRSEFSFFDCFTNYSTFHKSVAIAILPQLWQMAMGPRELFSSANNSTTDSRINNPSPQC
jgi:hypothetical protein